MTFAPVTGLSSKYLMLLSIAQEIDCGPDVWGTPAAECHRPRRLPAPTSRRWARDACPPQTTPPILRHLRSVSCWLLYRHHRVFIRCIGPHHVRFGRIGISGPWIAQGLARGAKEHHVRSRDDPMAVGVFGCCIRAAVAGSANLAGRASIAGQHVCKPSWSAGG
jgi:hypothetical protein